MQFPKYIMSACEKGQIRWFDNKKVEPVDKTGRTFTAFFEDEDEASKNKAFSLVNKIESFANRHGCGGTIGKTDWLWFQPLDGGAPYEQKLAYKAPFIKFSVCGDVAFELSRIATLSKVSDPLEFFMANTVLNGEKGAFLLRNRLVFVSRTGEADMKGRKILHSRSDHDRYRWHTSWFHDEAAKEFTEDERNVIGRETERVTFDLLRSFPNGLRNFSRLFYSSDTELDLVSEDEGNLFYIGEAANYWCRLINRQGDYNVYVTACLKP